MPMPSANSAKSGKALQSATEAKTPSQAGVAVAKDAKAAEANERVKDRIANKFIISFLAVSNLNKSFVVK